MDGVNLNTGSATPLPVEVVDSPVRLRNEQNEAQPGGAPQQQGGPRVNEGPSTVTTISP